MHNLISVRSFGCLGPVIIYGERGRKKDCGVEWLEAGAYFIIKEMGGHLF